MHRDCLVVFEASYYSAPYRLVSQTLWVRGGSRTVEVFTPDHQLVATHDRALRPGERTTLLAHLPPHKLPGLLTSRETFSGPVISLFGFLLPKKRLSTITMRMLTGFKEQIEFS